MDDDGEGEGLSHEVTRPLMNSPTSLTTVRSVAWHELKLLRPRHWSQYSLKRMRRDSVSMRSTREVRAGAEEGMGRR